MNIKILLWKLGLLESNKCPVCQGKLKPVGFPSEITGSQKYECIKKGCGFN